jgi:3-methyladenine DNA glycosylase AlkD
MPIKSGVPPKNTRNRSWNHRMNATPITSKRSPTLQSLRQELSVLADENRARSLARYFKTGRGEYGEGDCFLGIPVPAQRKVALRYCSLSLNEVRRLLRSPIHEHRFTALEILVAQYEKGSEESRESIFRFYLDHTKYINNWDLVDTSASYIVGSHLRFGGKALLNSLAASPNVWERRIAIVATFAFLRQGKLKDTLRIAAKLLADPHDLIHKAVGWALREAGKTDRIQLLLFLKKHYERMPRTTLRYAVERFPPKERKNLLQGKFEGI